MDLNFHTVLRFLWLFTKIDIRSFRTLSTSKKFTSLGIGSNFAAPPSEIKPIFGYVRNLVKNLRKKKSGSLGTFERSGDIRAPNNGVIVPHFLISDRNIFFE